MLGGRSYSICTVFILPADTSWEPCCDQAGHQVGGLGREVQRGGPVGVLADAVVFVAGVDEEFLEKAQALSRGTESLKRGIGEEKGVGGNKSGAGNRYGDLEQAELGGEMKRGVAIVAEVWVLQALGVVLDDALDEGKVVEVDGSAEAGGDVDPGWLVRTEQKVLCETIYIAEEIAVEMERGRGFHF